MDEATYVFCGEIEAEQRDGEDDNEENLISDGFGNWWDKRCPNCNSEMEIVRPGKVQCTNGCHYSVGVEI